MEKDFTPFGGTQVCQTDYNSAKIVVLPICFEHGASYGKGSSTGPLHLLAASTQLEFIDEENLTEFSDLSIYTRSPLLMKNESSGEKFSFDLTTNEFGVVSENQEADTPTGGLSGDPEVAVQTIKLVAKKIMEDGNRLLSIGGDHAITIGPVFAASELIGNIGVLQIDAHLDMRNHWNGSHFNHACVMRRIVEETGAKISQVGIRSFSKEEAVYIKQKGFSPFYAHNIYEKDDSWIKKAVDRLPENIYISIDLDGLDPSVIPGTGTPEPGGLTYRQVLKLIKYAGKTRNVIAADINELVKIPGTQVSEFTAAKLASKIMVYCF